MARVSENSLMQQIRTLSAGQSFSRSERIDMSVRKPASTKDVLQGLRNSMNQAVGRLRKEEAGSNFRVESVCAFTPDHAAAICTVVATRFDGPADDEDIDI